MVLREWVPHTDTSHFLLQTVLGCKCYAFIAFQFTASMAQDQKAINQIFSGGCELLLANDPHDNSWWHIKEGDVVLEEQATVDESNDHMINDKSVYNCVIYLHASWKRSMSQMRCARVLQESHKSQKCFNSLSFPFFSLLLLNI